VLAATAEPGIRPRVVRILALTVSAALLALIWVTYYFNSLALQQNFERSATQSLISETALLDEHLERSLNQVVNTLLSVGSITDIIPIPDEQLTADDLRTIVGNTPLVRSLSLLGPSGQVVASSNILNMGKRIPDAATLVPDNLNRTASGVIFGPVLPYRDLHEWASDRVSPTQQLMPAYLTLEKDGRTLTWVAIVNISFFHNLWQRIELNTAIEIAVYNYAGLRLFGHHDQAVDKQKVFEKVRAAIADRQIGEFYMSDDDYLVAYRADSELPKIFVSIANMESLGQEVRQEKRFLLSLALIASLFIVMVLLLTYRLYLRYERAAAVSRNLLRGMTAHLLMSRASKEGIIEDVNEPFLQATGYTREELIGQNHRILKGGIHPVEFYEHLWKTVSSGEIWRGTFHNRTKSGALIWLNATIIPFRNEWGHIDSFVGIYSDITQAIHVSQEYDRERHARAALEKLNQQLLNDANRDPLTGVANRRGLDHFLAQVRKTEELSSGMSVSVLMLDIDYFKIINDTWGHTAGDEVLCALTKTWQQTIRSSDVLVRLGGEEFAVVLLRSTLADAKRIAQTIRKLSEAVEVKVKGNDQPIKVTISIGVAHSENTQKTEIDDLLRRADAALYRAKSMGRNRVELADTDDQTLLPPVD
jgi:diguanylate cyclase (GGDEF)-like protein/PAS domain S-box-containing protein